MRLDRHTRGKVWKTRRNSEGTHWRNWFLFKEGRSRNIRRSVRRQCQQACRDLFDPGINVGKVGSVSKFDRRIVDWY